jgi:hypothetical protein
MAGQHRSEKLWSSHGTAYEFVSSRRPSFTGNNKTDSTDYSFLLWKKGWNKPWYYGTWLKRTDFQYWDEHDLGELNAVLK